MGGSRDGQRYRIGFDIGGTFTDFILLDGNTSAIKLHKCLTTPHDPSEGVLNGLAELTAREGVSLAQVGKMVHGTTLVTNALVEREGAKVGMITTGGFRDVIEIGTEQRYDIYDLFLPFPAPLVARKHRIEVNERIDRSGQVIEPLDVAAVKAAARQLAEDGIEAIAVCFLHSYLNADHERAAAEAIREVAPGVEISISSTVVAELWEYQRFVTTCANAYVQPLMNRYLARLQDELKMRGFTGTLHLMQSAGGLVSPELARMLPIRLLESGPAGGGRAAAFFGKLVDMQDVIAFDMGGTTAKACLIEGGDIEIASVMEVARLQRFKKGSGLPIKAPVIDMIEIGAGGGSIASIDDVGLLKIGPKSAGAAPGPACYGLGGLEPTVTDANLVLGYYDPGFFLGGTMALDKAASETALSGIANRLGLSVPEAAWGIHRTVVENMASAARIHLIEKGKDPRDYSVIGFGGAGPAHAVEVARALGATEVLIPPASGAASALGFLSAPQSFEVVRSYPMDISGDNALKEMDRLLAELTAEATAPLLDDGMAAGDLKIQRYADMRLAGQMHEISVELPSGAMGDSARDEVLKRFREEYSLRYSSVYDRVSIEIVSFRVRASGPTPELYVDQKVTRRGPAQKGNRMAWFGNGFTSTAVYDRYLMMPGEAINGPAIIEENEATTVIGPKDSVTVDASGTLRISVGRSETAPARITPQMGVAEARALIEADPIALEIMWSRLVTVVEEMWHTICRTAFSLIVSEAQDFACDILDINGESLAHSARSMPAFNLTLPRAVQEMLKKYPAETLRPGDVLMTNDPWICAGHLFDIAVVTPVFHGGRMVGLMGTVGHVGDIGGVNDSMRAHEIYDEGLQIPIIKLYDAGVPNEAVFSLFHSNVRKPEAVLGDIHAFVAANDIGGQRLSALMSEYGLQDLRALAEVVQSRAENAMREAIRALPDGVYLSEVSNVLLGKKLSYPLKLTISGDSIELDFEGAPPQLPYGGLNCTLSYTMAHASYPLKCALSPQIRGNAGCYRPITVKAPKGSIFNCTRPSSVAMRTRSGWYLAPNVFRALSEAAPDLVQAHTGLPTSIRVYGADAKGAVYSDHFFLSGGQGGGKGHDGKSAVLWPTSAANTSIELFEMRAPVLVMEKALVDGSGGEGEFRGGLGTKTRMRKLYDDGLPLLAAVFPEGVGVQAPGIFGGRPGGGAQGRILNADGSLKRDIGLGEMVTLSDTSEIIAVNLSGGSGYGDPADRDPELIRRDVDAGYVGEAPSSQVRKGAVAA